MRSDTSMRVHPCVRQHAVREALWCSEWCPSDQLVYPCAPPARCLIGSSLRTPYARVHAHADPRRLHSYYIFFGFLGAAVEAVPQPKIAQYMPFLVFFLGRGFYYIFWALLLPFNASVPNIVFLVILLTGGVLFFIAHFVIDNVNYMCGQVDLKV
jgi:hypothetical protein